MSAKHTRITHINDMPVEILLSIFATLVSNSLYARSIDDESYGSSNYPTLVSSVCKHWRHIAINAPQLWTCIELDSIPSSAEYVDLARLYLERSSDSPINFRLREPVTVLGDYMTLSERSSPGLDEKILLLLLSVVSRMRSFTLRYIRLESLVDIISTMVSPGSGYALQELSMRWTLRIASSLVQPIRPELLDLLLEPLRVLRLDSSLIELKSITCTRLVELQIVNLAVWPSAAEVAHVLNSNPGLRVVRLNLSLKGPPRSDTGPINLPDLRSIELNANHWFMRWLLSVLVPGSHGLRLDLFMALEEPDRADMEQAAAAFFQRAHVHSLDLTWDWVHLPLLLQFLPRLERLGFHDITFDSSTLAGAELWVTTLSRLHTIDLEECYLHNNGPDPGLRALIALPSVQRVRHYHCEGNIESEEVEKRWASLYGDLARKMVYSPELGLPNYANVFWWVAP